MARARLLFVAAGAVVTAGVVVIALSTQVACTDHSCESQPTWNVFGTWVDDHTWMSNNVNGLWTAYPSVTTINLCFNENPGDAGNAGATCLWSCPLATNGSLPVAARRTLTGWNAWLSIDPYVTSEAGNNIYAQAAGNSAEWANLTQNDYDGYFIQLTNASCSPYFVTVTLTFADSDGGETPYLDCGLPAPPADAGDADAGTDGEGGEGGADAGEGDATTD